MDDIVTPLPTSTFWPLSPSHLHSFNRWSGGYSDCPQRTDMYRKTPSWDSSKHPPSYSQMSSGVEVLRGTRTTRAEKWPTRNEWGSCCWPLPVINSRAQATHSLTNCWRASATGIRTRAAVEANSGPNWPRSPDRPPSLTRPLSHLTVVNPQRYKTITNAINLDLVVTCLQEGNIFLPKKAH